MAEPRVLGRTPILHGVRAFFWISGMWIRSHLAYRASFWMLVGGQFLVTGLDFVIIFVMFTHIRAMGGFELPEVAFLYATSGLAMGFADLLVGNAERIGRKIRDGQFDVLMIRPLPAFVQAAADDFGIHRIGRILQNAAVFVWAILALDIAWSWDRILLIPMLLVFGTVIFGSVFVLGGAFQFWAGDAAEVANAFTYGGSTMLQYPPTIFAREIVLAATFILPLSFVNWLPSLHILGHEDPIGLPDAFQFASPIAALLLAGVAALAWRTGVRNYRSTGS